MSFVLMVWYGMVAKQLPDLLKIIQIRSNLKLVWNIIDTKNGKINLLDTVSN